MSEKEKSQDVNCEEINKETIDHAVLNEEQLNQEEICEDATGEEIHSQDIIDDADDVKQEKKAGRFDKKKDKKHDAMKEKIDELEDKVIRQIAEFDNFRRRTEKEKSTMFEVGAKSVIEKILPIVDNFERGLATVPEDSKGSAFVDGMNMTYKQLMTELESIGVKPIEAAGKEFNPTYHNAVMQVESDTLESGMVAQELQKGYLYRESVVRHSMVAVVI